MNIETWADSSGCYVQYNIDECAYIVLDSEYGCLTGFWTPKGNDPYMPEDMTFSESFSELEDEWLDVYFVLAKVMYETFGVLPNKE